MNKGELKQNHAKYKRLMAHRVEREGRVIDALPTKVDVTRIVGPKGLDSPEDASIEVPVSGYTEALQLMGSLFDHKLAPIPLSQINAERVPGRKTMSFLPSARIPRRWREDFRCQIGEVFPVLYQLTPNPDDSLRPRVWLEWYAEPAHEVIINVRAIVGGEFVMWRRTAEPPHRVGSWAWVNAPTSDCGRVLGAGPHKPPCVTLWWHKGCPEDRFRRMLLGATEEVAHVE